MPTTRRHLLLTSLPALAVTTAFAQHVNPTTQDQRAIAQLESGSGGRLGVCVLNTATGSGINYRSSERFPLCSTFKFLAAAAVLHKVDRGQLSLSQRVHFTKADLFTYAPISATHVDSGMTIAELCEAAVTLSDNTAANLLLALIGGSDKIANAPAGPAALTAFARSIGDTVTRLDRTELSLNTAIPGDPRDTSSPAQLVADLQSILLGNVLSAASRAQLTQWLRDCKTGSARLRAGVPADWVVGDKTGTGNTGTGTSNDLAILWPPPHLGVPQKPVLAAVYLTGATVNAQQQSAVIAEVGKLIAASITA